jgi:phage terminase large subunit GpA-like protein
MPVAEYVCPHCGWYFNRRVDYYNHVACKHAKFDNLDEPLYYQCPIDFCRQKFSIIERYSKQSAYTFRVENTHHLTSRTSQKCRRILHLVDCGPERSIYTTTPILYQQMMSATNTSLGLSSDPPPGEFSGYRNIKQNSTECICPHCGAFFTLIFEFHMHTSAEHMEWLNGKRYYQCPLTFCLERFTNLHVYSKY